MSHKEKNPSAARIEALRHEIGQLKRQIEQLTAERDSCKLNAAKRVESELRYRTIFENTGTATILIEADLTICACNQKFAQLVGLCRQEIEGRIKWPRFIHPDDIAPMKRYHQDRRIDPDAAPKKYEFRLVNTSGESRNIILTIDMIPGSLQSVASLMDISDRMEAEKALRAGEEKYRLLVESMNDGLAVQDPNGILTYVNPRASAMLGYSQQELTGMATVNFIAKDFTEIWKKQIALRKKGSHQPYEIVWLNKAGERIYTIVSPRALYDEHRRYRGSFAILTDITAYKHTVEALRLSEEMFSKAFRSSPSSILIATLSDQRIINVNDSFVKNTGHGMYEVIGKTFSQIKLFAKAAQVEQMAAALSQKGNLRRLQIDFYSKSGELRKGVMSAECIQLWGQDCILAAIEDITESEQLQRQIMQVSERERHRIGRDLHDDLCPHLIGVEALSKVLLNRIEHTDMQGGELLVKIRELIQEAIDKTRRLSHGLCPVNLFDRGLEASLSNLADQIQTVYGVHCRFYCENKLVLNEEDVAGHIYYIAQEAAVNAVKHAHCNCIEIKIINQKKRLVLLIEDDGRGMPENRNINGMGLSLMTFRATVIGARLEIKNRANQGTKVSLVLNYGDREKDR